MSRDSAESQTAVQRARELVNDSSKALRAEKTVDGADAVDDPRTAVRYVTTENTVPQFQVVSTKVQGFPEGKDMVGIHGLDNVADWIEQNDPQTIAVSDDTGFEQTEYADDSYQQVMTDGGTTATNLGDFS